MNGIIARKTWYSEVEPNFKSNQHITKVSVIFSENTDFYLSVEIEMKSVSSYVLH